ncbi:flagellar biosynthesis anti-sigma factor FlgM [Janthinobacterium fluminis]|uniref:Negative regulator of flagellin synthesis n=1 Tax=Janthinobacterium fluminis TaxID=2987524 RepID=A0ABT5JUQ6_9BURK|nr:flagellar biosynthesis anti-sigma factor FlgM [Janthinobacterium fluminis]MDC8756488.1 flagellar biosynthesis anti-sigma factor FlgM [Janthinobacterium fluminis]
MRVNSGNAIGETAALKRVADAAPAEAAADAGAAAGPALQSVVLQPALEALRQMPDVDHERVAQLRDALAKGELPFDPSKLAGLIQRFHGGES